MLNVPDVMMTWPTSRPVYRTAPNAQSQLQLAEENAPAFQDAMAPQTSALRSQASTVGARISVDWTHPSLAGNTSIESAPGA